MHTLPAQVLRAYKANRAVGVPPAQALAFATAYALAPQASAANTQRVLLRVAHTRMAQHKPHPQPRVCWRAAWHYARSNCARPVTAARLRQQHAR